jgi:hypothetical protein
LVEGRQAQVEEEEEKKSNGSDFSDWPRRAPYYAKTLFYFSDDAAFIFSRFTR